MTYKDMCEVYGDYWEDVHNELGPEYEEWLDELEKTEDENVDKE